ncbi:MAG: cytochrome P450 [Ktedonobacteraceae bacterium]|nr:cytochrome P450 [Ktedonobacteraceae bacterium]
MNKPGGNSAPGGILSTGLFSEAFLADPFPLFAQLRSKGAVVALPVPSGSGTSSFWMVTQLEEAIQVLKNQLFTVDPSTIPLDDNQPSSPRGLGGLGGILGQSMIAVDEPDHRRLRSLVSKAFTPKYIQSLRPGIQKIADDLLDRVQEQGHMDLVNEYAFPLPINVISNMLGVPSEGQALIREWSELFSSGGAARQDPSRLMITQTFAEYLLKIIAEKRAHPQDDLISQLVQIEEAGDRLDEGELLSMIALLIFAGHETTSNLIGNGMLMLFDYPAQMQRLRADPSLVPAAVEEFLRYNGPVLAPAPRYATADVTLGGQQIRKGDTILTMLGSANRDEAQFTQPEELDIARSLNRHVAFGQGIHVCLGAPLARLEGDIAFTTLLRRLPALRLAVARDAITWRGGFVLRGISSLPVAF